MNEPHKVLKECKRILQKNGKIIIVVPAPSNPRYMMKGHKHFFTKKSLLKLVGKYFSNVRIFGYRGDTKNWPIVICRTLGYFVPNQLICIAWKLEI